MAWWHRPQATRIYPLRPDPAPTHPSQGLCLPTGKRNPRRTRGVKEGAWQGSRQRGWSRAGAAGGPTGRRARPRPGRVASAGLGAQALAGLTARGHTDVRVGVEEDVAVWTEAALRQRLVLRAVVPARPGRRPGTSVHADSVRGRKQRARTERGVVRGPRCPMGLGRRSGWGGAAQRSWAGGPGHFSKSPAGCSQTLWTPPPTPFPPSAHLESQVTGCTGPHGSYTFPGGQVRSGSTETGVRWAGEARAPLSPSPATHHTARRWHCASHGTRPWRGRVRRRPPASGRAPRGQPGSCR